MAGRLECLIDGQSFIIETSERDVVFNAKPRVLRKILRHARHSVFPELLKVADIRVGIRLGWFGKIVVPAKSRLCQLLMRRV